MARARFPLWLALGISLLTGSAPLRVAAHTDGDHARVWLPTAAHLAEHHAYAVHALGEPEERREGRTASVARAARPASGCTGCACHKHPEPPASPPAQDAPAAPADDGHCHCDDLPLVTGSLFTPVRLEAPAAAGWAVAAFLSLCLAPGAPEVAPPSPEGVRVPRESDPIVLIR